MALDIQRMMAQLSPARPIDLGGSSGAREALRLQRERFEFEKQQAQREKELRLLEEQGRMARERMLRAEKQAELEAAKAAALLAKQQEQLGKAGEAGGGGKSQALHAMSPLMDQLGYDQIYRGSVDGLATVDFVNRADAQKAEDEAFDKRVWHGSRPEMEGGERPGFYALPREIDALDPGAENAVQSLNRLQGLGLGYPTNERGTLEDPGGADRPRLTGSVDDALTLEPQVGGVDPSVDDALAPGENDYVAGQDNDPDSPAPPIAEVSVGGRGMIPALLEPGDPFARALAASRAASEAGGLPARAPDEEDYMGAVPRNRIDMAAMNAETLARLNPALQARVAGLPPELQEAAKQNAAAIGGLGLEATDALAEQDKAMRDPVSIYNSQQNLLAEQTKFETTRADRQTVQNEQWREMGFDRARNSFKDAKIEDSITAVKSAATVRALMKGDKRNQEKAVNFLMALTINKGPQTEADALRIIGRGRLGSIDQLKAWLHERIVGGFEPEDIAAINEFADLMEAQNKTAIFDWLSANDQQSRNARINPRIREGYEEFRKGGAIPFDLLDEYDKISEKADAELRKERGASSAGASSAGASAADAELQRQADAAGLNGQVLGQLMGGESGGNPKAANEDRTDGLPKSSAKGVFQLLDSTAQAMGFKDAAEYSAQPLEKQIEVGLELFKNKGLKADSPAEDYALVLAAPSKVGKWKSRDEVVYEADSPELAGNPGWRSAPGGAATVGSITDYYLKAGKQRAAEADKAEPAKGTERKADPANPYPDNPKAKRALDLLEKL